MREFKFRAWDKKKKEMIIFRNPNSGDEKTIHIYDNYDVVQWNSLIFGFPTADSYHDCKSIDNFELMQWTGLKDKNGVEIYEGDIMKSSNGELYVVEFEEYAELSHARGTISGWLFNEYDLVVGNIWVNPEMIK